MSAETLDSSGTFDRREPVQLSFTEIQSGNAQDEVVYLSHELPKDEKRLLVVKRGRQYLAIVMESGSSDIIFEGNLCEELGLAETENDTERLQPFISSIKARVQSVADLKSLLFKLREHSKIDTHIEGVAAEMEPGKIVHEKIFRNTKGEKTGGWTLKVFPSEGTTWITITTVIDRGNGQIHDVHDYHDFSGWMPDAVISLLEGATCSSDLHSTLAAQGLLQSQKTDAGHGVDNDVKNGSGIKMKDGHFLKLINQESVFELVVEEWVEDLGYQIVFREDLAEYLPEDPKFIDSNRRDRFIEALKSNVISLKAARDLFLHPHRIAAFVSGLDEDDFSFDNRALVN